MELFVEMPKALTYAHVHVIVRAIADAEFVLMIAMKTLCGKGYTNE
jgi:hypothetical protein